MTQDTSGTTGTDRIVTDYEAYLFGEGHWLRAWEKMGARPAERRRRAGYSFVVWAPNAAGVSVVGAFNDWDGRVAPACRSLGRQRALGSVRPGRAGRGDIYKFEISPQTGPPLVQADPYGSGGRSCRRAPRPSRPISGQHAWRDDGVDGGAPGAASSLERPMADLRSARRIVAPQSARGTTGR